MTPAGAELARRRSLPPGGMQSMQVMADGWPLRAILWPAVTGKQGSILFLGGRGDFIEKYAEGLWALTDAGWGVASFDWRGQGLSGRVGKSPMHGDAPDGDFALWASDLAAMSDWFRANMPGPHMIVAHSMGGHLTLRHLADHPHDFARAVLLSPMAGVRAPPLGPVIARAAAALMVMLGQGRRFVAGGGPYRAGVAGSARQRLLTSDPVRYADEAWWCAQNPALAIGSVTWGWLDAAFRSMAALRARLPGITTPVAIHMAAADGLVDSAATRALAAAMPDARLTEYAGAGHELLRESDAVRCAVLAAVLEFLHTPAR
ncbi:alpha/beta hydrolase [Sandarakinorhabdus sp.]|uniref:alpha/beta hydrolase n=1 Tax=Sandarakinorhabdus sp. TaxID=1916663 RepID=UPI00286DEA4F|nr:alpha/beta hydrolase [Sandarakinorhabdus sp.]